MRKHIIVAVMRHNAQKCRSPFKTVMREQQGKVKPIWVNSQQSYSWSNGHYPLYFFSQRAFLLLPFFLSPTTPFFDGSVEGLRLTLLNSSSRVKREDCPTQLSDSSAGIPTWAFSNIPKTIVNGLSIQGQCFSIKKGLFLTHSAEM